MISVSIILVVSKLVKMIMHLCHLVTMISFGDLPSLKFVNQDVLMELIQKSILMSKIVILPCVKKAIRILTIVFMKMGIQLMSLRIEMSIVKILMIQILSLMFKVALILKLNANKDVKF